MDIWLRLLFSLFIGLVALGIAWLVHPDWKISSFVIFGVVVFVVTAILALLIKRN
jgi:hypothetical protein